MSSTEKLSWLGDPDVSVMSEDGHRVMTHRAVLGLYSSSFRHLLSINPTEGETCMIIFHDMNLTQLSSLVSTATNNFQRFIFEGYPNEDDIENQTMLNSNMSLVKPCSMEDTVTVEEKVETGPPTPSYDLIESTSGSSSSLNYEYIEYDTDTLEIEDKNDEKNYFTPSIKPMKLISIEDVNISIDKNSEADYLSLDSYGEINPETKTIACNLCDKTYSGNVKKKNSDLMLILVTWKNTYPVGFAKKNFSLL